MTALLERPLGTSGLRITHVGFGAWAIGGGGWAYGWGTQADADSIAAIHHAVSRGINWVDTAAIYGLGHSEEVVGRALRELPATERPYVFTKVGLVWDENDRLAAQVGKLDLVSGIARELEIRCRLAFLDHLVSSVGSARC